jgi:hypothetical protein
MLALLKDQFGIDLTRLLAAKTDVATAQAEAGGAGQAPVK